MSDAKKRRILLLEAFYGGSHKHLIDYLESLLRKCDHDVEKIIMSDKKWHWRMRTSSLYFSQIINKNQERIDTVFVSAVINLAELTGMCRLLQSAHKVLYFHENQLIYPVRKQQDRDFQYGYNQIMSCLTADVILFNSEFNMASFLNNINTFMNLMPDHRPKGLPELIKPKCHVLYYLFTIPPELSSDGVRREDKHDDEPLHIVWPHRWEHDKNPEDFFQVLFQLADAGCSFRVSVLGQTYQNVPEIFEEAKRRLNGFILNWGYQECKQKYYNVLRDADVTVSTALHEFFGVSMLEAVSSGSYPLCPNRLVYPELFPDCYLYNTTTQLFKKLKNFCKYPKVARQHVSQVDLSRFKPSDLEKQYLHHILPT